MLSGIVFFALCSIVFNFVIFLIDQITYKHKFIPLVFKAFEDVGESRRCVVGVVVEKNNRAVFCFTCNALTNTVSRGVISPIQAVNIPLNGVHFEFGHSFDKGVVVVAVGWSKQGGGFACDFGDFFVAT